MGAGLAVFREGGEVTYYNLWLPARFPLLYVYVAREQIENIYIVFFCVDDWDPLYQKLRQIRNYFGLKAGCFSV